MKKYCLHPGEVLSKNDRDLHHIPAITLARLYNVDWRECIEFDLRKRHDPENMICLYPRYDGKYKLTPSRRGR